MAVIRPQASLLAAGAAVVLGIAGLIGGALPQSQSAGAGVTAASTIIVGGAYIRQPASPTVAAAYFTVFNTGDKPDLLITVATGGGEESSLHTDSAGGMQLAAGGLTVPAHGSVALSPGKGHLMIQKLYGPLLPGQNVNLELTFQNAGVILVSAPVIAIADPAPIAVAPK